jgi:hypothetical protein
MFCNLTFVTEITPLTKQLYLHRPCKNKSVPCISENMQCVLFKHTSELETLVVTLQPLVTV